jgi:hypothetical protein
MIAAGGKLDLWNSRIRRQEKCGGDWARRTFSLNRSRASYKVGSPPPKRDGSYHPSLFQVVQRGGGAMRR